MQWPAYIPTGLGTGSGRKRPRGLAFTMIQLEPTTGSRIGTGGSIHAVTVIDRTFGTLYVGRKVDILFSQIFN